MSLLKLNYVKMKEGKEEGLYLLEHQKGRARCPNTSIRISILTQPFG
jgi:hypothetical protein